MFYTITNSFVDHWSLATVLTVTNELGDSIEMPTEASDYRKQQLGSECLADLMQAAGLETIDGPSELIGAQIDRFVWDSIKNKINPPLPKKADVSPVLAPPPCDKSEGSRFVYVISAADADPPLCKIGIANSPEKRLAQLSTGSPHVLRLELARLTNEARAVERAAHSHFSDFRRNGEWFAICSDEAITYIIDATRSAA